MNFQIIRKILGHIMCVEAVFMLPALGISLARGERRSVMGFAITMLLLLVLGLILSRKQAERKDYYAREGFITAGLTWLVVSIFGALPFTISGAIPSFVDSFFETVSGFTTTGASILTHVEGLPMGILYWRSFTHWLGGMGVLVFLLAISPIMGDTGDALYLLRAESPGINVGKLVPRMRRSAATLYLIYVALTVLQFVLLVFDMPVFDALTTAFGTAGTGGFAIKNDSLTSYSVYSQAVTTVFMFLFAVNFTVYYLLLLRRFRQALGSQELLCYLGIAVVSILIISVDILPIFGSLGTAVHHASFTVGSVMSTTGFAISDFDLWPELSRCILLVLMFIGACAGSTGGGIKVVRILLLVRIAKREVRRTLHPHEVKMVHMDGMTVDEKTVSSVANFVLIYIVITTISTLLLALEGKDFTTTFSSVAACINNVGPGLGAVGPTLNYSCYTWFGKLVLSFAMLFGRLELYPMLALFIPSAWKK